VDAAMMRVSDGPGFASHENLDGEVVKVEYRFAEAVLDPQRLADGEQVRQKHRYSIREIALAIIAKVYRGLCSFS
jgi:hypothetical protein